jgi:hypothetical protein
LDEKPEPGLLLVATLWWPNAARLALAFLHRGCRVSAICPLGHPLRSVTGLDSTYLYRALNPSSSLESAIRVAQPDLIIPCDDGALWQLYELYATKAEFHPLVERSLGSGEAYQTLKSRYKVLREASSLGIRVPSTRAIESIEDFNEPGLEWPAILKTDGTWGGEGVAVVRNAAQAARKLDSITGPRAAANAWWRFLVKRHPLALWLWRRRKDSKVTMQKFVSGREATTMIACWQGEVVASVTVEVLASQSPAGSAVIVRLIRNDEIDRASRLLADRFSLNGFHGLDFVIEDGTSAVYMIEMNPRATQLGHLNVCPEGNLADALAAKLMKEPSPPADETPRIPGDTVAFFPQAWKVCSASPLLAQAFHDVPRDQPALVEELMREPWPERRLLSRIFKALRRRPLSSHVGPEPPLPGRGNGARSPSG